MNWSAPSVHIERLDLDLRGIPPADAEAAVHLLRPALQQALAARLPHRTSSTAAANTIQVTAGASPADLARTIAANLASTIRRDSAS